MFEGDALLTIRIGYVSTMKPLVEQEDLAAGFRRQLDHRSHVALFHAEDQVGLAQHGRGELAASMVRAIEAMFGEQFACGAVDRVADHGAKAGAGQLDVAVRQGLPEEALGGRAPADVADADCQYPFEHCNDILPVSWTGKRHRMAAFDDMPLSIMVRCRSGQGAP